MEIIRGSLEDISRPASSEQTGSRVSSVSVPHSDRIGSTTPFSLVVLTDDAADIQVQSSSEETVIDSSTDKGECHTRVTDEDEEELKLQRAIQEMRRLDQILSTKMHKEKEVKRQRKELQAKLWQELLQNKPEGHSECAQEAMNTKLFLALEAPSGAEEEDNFAPVFETQVPDCEHSRDDLYMEQSETRPDGSPESFELGHEETGEKQFEGSQCGASNGKKKQKDFVKRNIELVSSEGDEMLLTDSEKERLAELLQEIDSEEEDGARGADSEEDMWAVSVLTGQGYTPEPSDLEQLIDIDSKIRPFLPVEEFLSQQSSYTTLSMSQEDMWALSVLTGQGYTPEPSDLEQLIDIDAKIRPFLPVEEFLSQQSSYTTLSMSQGRGSELDGDLQPGEKVLQYMKERRGQERRLRQIQEQLESLGQSQDMTNESPELTEEQLRDLLDECELTETSDPGSPWDP